MGIPNRKLPSVHGGHVCFGTVRWPLLGANICVPPFPECACVPIKATTTTSEGRGEGRGSEHSLSGLARKIKTQWIVYLHRNCDPGANVRMCSCHRPISTWVALSHSLFLARFIAYLTATPFLRTLISDFEYFVEILYNFLRQPSLCFIFSCFFWADPTCCPVFTAALSTHLLWLTHLSVYLLFLASSDQKDSNRIHVKWFYLAPALPTLLILYRTGDWKRSGVLLLQREFTELEAITSFAGTERMNWNANICPLRNVESVLAEF